MSGGVQHAVVARTLGTKAEVVAHQHIACAQPAHQHFTNDGLSRLRCQPSVKGKNDALVNAALGQFEQLVAQRGNAGWSQFGLAGQRSKIVAWMRLKSNDATGHASVQGFVFQKRQHGLVAAVNAVKIANRQRAGGGQLRVLVTAKNFHESDYRFYGCQAAC